MMTENTTLIEDYETPVQSPGEPLPLSEAVSLYAAACERDSAYTMAETVERVDNAIRKDIQARKGRTCTSVPVPLVQPIMTHYRALGYRVDIDSAKNHSEERSRAASIHESGEDSRGPAYHMVITGWVNA